MSITRRAFHLQNKVSLTLVFLIATFVIVSYTILQAVIAPAFDKLETTSAKSDLHRAEAALLADIENLQAITGDWAPWDDIHDYVRGESPGFQKSNLDNTTLANLGLNIMAVYGANSRLVWAQGLSDAGSIHIDQFDIFNSNHPLFSSLTAHSDKLAQIVGIVDSSLGPLIISSRPILRTDESGPVAGALVMGQFLGESRLEKLRQRTEVDMDWIAANPEIDTSREAVFTTEQYFVGGQKILVDIDKQPILLLRTRTSRDISGLGSQTITVATGFLIVAGILVCGFIWVVLRQTILSPIEQLANHIDDIRNSGDLTRQVSMHRSDEIGALADQFDDMTREVNDARQALLDQSFKAGKADTAAEVMHNIRNAMTPMINGLERVRKSLRVSENLRVVEAIEQVGDVACPRERKNKFLEYISASFDHLKTVSENALEDMNIVSSQAQQIEGILSDQERFANVTPVAETLGIDELLDEAANVIPKDEQENVELIVDDDLDQRRVRAYRIGLLQVMGNLILNAFESIKRQGTAAGKISLAAVHEVIDEQLMVRVTVTDNGSGFDQSTKEQMFQRGFTSKTKGRLAGLGLHWCANAVAGMGGRLSAESIGQGCGAKFHVLLPAARGN